MLTSPGSPLTRRPLYRAVLRRIPLAAVAYRWARWVSLRGVEATRVGSDALRMGLFRGCSGFAACWLAEVAQVWVNQRRRPDDDDGTPAGWYRTYRPGARLLDRFRRTAWPAGAPTFAVVVGGGSPSGLAGSLASLCAQTYPRWQIAGEGADPADYVLWLRAGDALEPHALHRLACAILTTGADLLYSDEVTGEGDALAVHTRAAFSYDHVLCRDYLGSLLAVRAPLLEAVEPDGPPAARPGLDLLLRLLERAAGVAHVADVLYRRAGCADPSEPADPEADRDAVRRHLGRRGVAAEVRTLPRGSGRDVSFPVEPGSKVAIVIPTKDRLPLLRRCLESLEATVPRELADVWVVDHDSRDPEARAYLAGLPGRRSLSYRVLSHSGSFNFSVINNFALAEAARRGRYTHYLLLNNDTEAVEQGWLERLLGHACRPEVGVAAPLLLYADGSVQHAGVSVGLHYCAENRGRNLGRAYAAGGSRRPGPDSVLVATRDQQAATGACLLVRADVYWKLAGLDESLAVGLGDVDFGLRAHAAGYKVLVDGQAVLIHHESATRGRGHGQHPGDTIRFRRRYRRLIFSWDLYSSPLQARDAEGELPRDTRARWEAPTRYVPVTLPGAAPTEAGEPLASPAAHPA